MAKLIQAVGLYGPRVTVARTVQTRQIAEYIASRTSLNRSEIEGVLRDPIIDLGGVLDVGFRLDTSIDGALNAPGAFTGEVTNRENVGKSSADLKQLWNTDHPDDQIP